MARDVTFKLNSISSGLDLGDYGKEGSEESLYARTLNSVDTSVTFIYDAYVNGKKVSNLAGLSGKVKNQSQITNPIGNFDIDFGPEHFVSTNLNFQEPELEQKSFKASIKSASDGDTFEVIANETKSIGGKISVQKGQSYRIRLMGIDTPEKGITKLQGYVKAAPFEYAFALRSSEFAEKIKEQYGSDILVAFVDGKDAFGRVTAEIMFGPEYKYSYNSEILRAGLTLLFS
ncbi:thermonuclease family protein [Mycoplasmopsis felis]|uniref:thermonuclease family protein n=1 Tax=Mycoplasmopsis felis TaxID=33923 RepID=UPI0021AF2E71|nr:thermonuclease family protein [Mycoplasmopsis felis]UWW00467.1 thermonuclease family protein [Mycoplasmopsis felis]